QVSGTNVGLESARDQRHDVHEGLGRLTGILREIPDLLQSQHVTGFPRARLAHREAPVVSTNRLRNEQPGGDADRARPIELWLLSQTTRRPGWAGYSNFL